MIADNYLSYKPAGYSYRVDDRKNEFMAKFRKGYENRRLFQENDI